jgi:hypothetical protein
MGVCMDGVDTLMGVSKGNPFMDVGGVDPLMIVGMGGVDPFMSVSISGVDPLMSVCMGEVDPLWLWVWVGWTPCLGLYEHGYGWNPLCPVWRTRYGWG